MPQNKDATHFIVTYRDVENLFGNKTISLKVKNIEDSKLGLSFVRLTNFIFDESSILVDPKTESLKKRFENTKSLHISIYNIISIEEVGSDHKGLHFKKDKSNLLVMNSEPNRDLNS